MATQGERLASLERGLSDHEKACEQRLVDIKTLVATTDGKIDSLQKFVIGLIVAVCGFALVTLAGLVLRGSGLA